MNVFKRLLMLSGGGTSVPYDYPDKFAFFANQAVVEPSVLEVLRPDDRLGDFTVARVSSAYYTDSNGVIKEALYNVARIDYTNGVAELLTEPQSTNLVTQSYDFSSPWLSANCTVNPDVQNSPDDNVTGTSRINLIASDGAALKFNDSSASGVHTMSIWVRRVLISNDDDFRMAYYNVTDGVVYSPTFTATNEWQRFEWSPAPTVGNNQWWFINNPTSVERDFLIWGAQLEELPYATSYIPTNGSTVTRLQDVITDGGNVNVINSEEGTLFFEGSALFDDGTNREITITDGTNDNRILIRMSSTSNQLACGVYVATSNEAYFSHILSNSTENFKVALKWKVNDFALWINGVEVGTDTLGISLPSDTIYKLNLSNAAGSGSYLFGRTRALKVYDRALTDEELEQITTL